MTKAEQTHRMAWRFKVLQQACERSLIPADGARLGEIRFTGVAESTRTPLSGIKVVPAAGGP